MRILPRLRTEMGESGARRVVRGGPRQLRHIAPLARTVRVSKGRGRGNCVTVGNRRPRDAWRRAGRRPFRPIEPQDVV
ncbi:hypothetical protein BLAT2472_10314 [Burkholderia latens]